MRTRKKLQRLMAMALSAALCAAMLPTLAFAADTSEPSTPYLADLTKPIGALPSIADGTGTVLINSAVTYTNF